MMNLVLCAYPWSSQGLVRFSKAELLLTQGSFLMQVRHRLEYLQQKQQHQWQVSVECRAQLNAVVKPLQGDNVLIAAHGNCKSSTGRFSMLLQTVP